MPRQPLPCRHQRDQNDEQQPPSLPEHGAHLDQCHGYEGEGGLAFLEHGDDLGHHEGEQEEHDSSPDQHHEYRIGQGSGDPAPDLGLVLLELGQPLQHHFQGAARLARRDHADVALGEDGRLGGQ